VHFDYYTFWSLTMAVDLVNTHSEPTGAEDLADPSDLELFLDRYRDPGTLLDGTPGAELDLPAISELYRRARAGWRLTPEAVAELRAVRGILRGAFAAAPADRTRLVELLNGALGTYRALPRVSADHDEPHLHFEAADKGVVHWLAVTALMGMVIFVCGAPGNASRLGLCASGSCRRAFVDRSKNGQKKYCSDTCAHRESVAAYRARARSATADRS
jgi:predicted RNA-binding Zn ribbon-like protein